jgi:3-methyladenine DNA glycosylase AlkC
VLELTIRLIDQLAETAADLPYSADKVCALLSELEQTGDIMAVLGVYPLLCSELKAKPKDGVGALIVRLNLTTERAGFAVPLEVTAAAVCCIARLMSAVRAEQVPEADARLRSFRSWVWGISANWAKWAEPTTPDTAVVQGLPGAALALGALSTDRSGYVREVAVRLLAMDTSSESFPFLLWRAADWVEEVRALASEAVQERLADDRFLPDFVNSLPLLNRMERLERVDLSNLAGLIHARLLEEPGNVSIVRGLQSTNTHVRRACAELIGRIQPVPDAGAIALIAASRDLLLRIRAMDWEPRLRAVDPESARALRTKFLRDKSNAVRVAALRAEVEVADEATVELVWSLVADDSLGVRECTRYHIRRLVGTVDFAAFYRNVLSESATCIPGAIAGLGETGSQADYDAVSKFMNGSPKQRACALRAMASLDPVRVRAAAIASLVDESGTVRRIALRIVGFSMSDDEAQLLIGCLPNASERGAIDTVVVAAKRLGPWQALDLLLSAVITVANADVAIDAIESWQMKEIGMYTLRGLGAGEQEKFLAKLAAVADQLSTSTVERLAMKIEGQQRPR